MDFTRESAVLAEGWGIIPISAERVRKVWRIETPAGVFCLKRSGLSPNDALFVERLVAHARRRGFARAPAAIPDRRGAPFLEYGGAIYLLFPWIDGREADFDREENLASAVAVLAEFHRAGAGFVPYRSDPERVRWGAWPALFAARFAQLCEFGARAAMVQSSPFCRLYGHLFPYYLAEADRALRLLTASPYQRVTEEGLCRRTVCHHDPSPRNLLIDTEGRPFLIDFEYSLADLRLHDLANLLLRLLRRHGWRPEIARKVIDLYHRESPLDERELAVLYPFLLWPQDFWQAGLQFFLERLPWFPERFLETLRRRTEDREERAAFLAWYESEYWRPERRAFSASGPGRRTLFQDQLEMAFGRPDLAKYQGEGDLQGELEGQVLAVGSEPGSREALSGRFDLLGYVAEAIPTRGLQPAGGGEGELVAEEAEAPREADPPSSNADLDREVRIGPSAVVVQGFLLDPRHYPARPQRADGRLPMEEERPGRERDLPEIHGQQGEARAAEGDLLRLDLHAPYPAGEEVEPVYRGHSHFQRCQFGSPPLDGPAEQAAERGPQRGLGGHEAEGDPPEEPGAARIHVIPSR